MNYIRHLVCLFVFIYVVAHDLHGMKAARFLVPLTQKITSHQLPRINSVNRNSALCFKEHLKGNFHLKQIFSSEPALHIAVKTKDNGALKALLEISKEDIDEYDYQGKTALSVAIDFGAYNCVATLIDAKVDVNKVNACDPTSTPIVRLIHRCFTAASIDTVSDYELVRMQSLIKKLHQAGAHLKRFKDYIQIRPLLIKQPNNERQEKIQRWLGNYFSICPRHE